MNNSQNVIRYNTRTRSQQKTVIILIFIVLGMSALFFIANHIEIALKVKLIDEKIDKVTEILYEIGLGIVMECLALYFTIKLDRIGIFIFAWLDITYLILIVFTALFGIIVFINQSPASAIDKNHSESAAVNGIDIAMLIIGSILLIALIVKITFMFKLGKSLKGQNQEDVQQLHPLV